MTLFSNFGKFGVLSAGGVGSVQIEVAMWGGAGASGISNPMVGAGGFMTAVYELAPGPVVLRGAGGGQAGPHSGHIGPIAHGNGGRGSAGPSPYTISGGGGGGHSGIFIGSVSHANALVMAGGGGGGSYISTEVHPQGGGYPTGGRGSYNSTYGSAGAFGGTQSAGGDGSPTPVGARGGGANGFVSTDGAALAGGNGGLNRPGPTSYSFGGAGGGGGYYGGSGGPADGGRGGMSGGGGSGFFAADGARINGVTVTLVSSTAVSATNYEAAGQPHPYWPLNGGSYGAGVNPSTDGANGQNGAIFWRLAGGSWSSAITNTDSSITI